MLIFLFFDITTKSLFSEDEFSKNLISADMFKYKIGSACVIYGANFQTALASTGNFSLKGQMGDLKSSV